MHFFPSEAFILAAVVVLLQLKGIIDNTRVQKNLFKK